MKLEDIRLRLKKTAKSHGYTIGYDKWDKNAIALSKSQDPVAWIMQIKVAPYNPENKTTAKALASLDLYEVSIGFGGSEYTTRQRPENLESAVETAMAVAEILMPRPIYACGVPLAGKCPIKPGWEKLRTFSLFSYPSNGKVPVSQDYKKARGFFDGLTVCDKNVAIDITNLVYDGVIPNEKIERVDQDLGKKESKPKTK